MSILQSFVAKVELPLRASELSGAAERLLILVPDELADGDEDYAILLTEHFDTWRRGADPDDELRGAYSVMLDSTEAALLGLTGSSYFELHSALMRGGKRDWKGLSHGKARLLLSRVLFIHQVLKYEQMSASQISRLFSALENSLDVPYKAIQVVARHFDLLPELSGIRVSAELWPSDEDRSREFFTDVSINEASEICGGLCSAWTDPDSFSSTLNELVSSVRESDGKVGWPYLQILHWCCLPLEYYDHPASHLYEFNARGKIADDLFDRYSSVATGNAILNNAKAVASLDTQWAKNRSGDDAHALVRVLEQLESLPFLARREMARYLRAWLLRIMELMQGETTQLRDFEGIHEVHRLIDSVVASDTRSRGVIEQRVVDALCVLAFSSESRVAKGLGDSVNASNFSRHKLGDIEFANVDKRHALAIEAHGGVLSEVYVNNHRGSLNRIVEQRLKESWEDLDAAESWAVNVLFVSHGRVESLPANDTLHGVDVTYSYCGYGELANSAFARSSDEAVLEAFSEYFVAAMNRQTVPQWIRDLATSLM